MDNHLMLEDSSLCAKFQTRFRDPYANYLELLQWIIDDARFARWCGEKINNEMSSPIQLSLLGSMRYLGQGWTFDDIAKWFIVPCSMPSLILAVLPSIPGLYSLLCICLRLYPTCENIKWQDFLDALDRQTAHISPLRGVSIG